MLSEVQKLLSARIMGTDERLRALNDCKSSLELDIRLALFSVCLYVCLFVCLFICCLLVCLFVDLFMCLYLVSHRVISTVRNKSCFIKVYTRRFVVLFLSRF